MEKAAGTLADVHWARLRVAALGEVSLLYRDFADEVAKLPVPKGLSDEDLKAFKGMVEETRAPFVKRFEELRGKALELAAETGVDDDQMNALVSDAEWVAIKTPRLEASFLDSLDPKYTWTEPVPHALRVAIAAENWPLALFLAGEGEEKKSLTPRQARAARALFYSHAGAAAEALAEVTKVAEELNEQSRPRAFAYMIPRYYKVHQKDKVASYLNEFVKLDGYKQGVTGVGETAVRALVGAANWAQVSVPGSFEASLMQQARGGGR
jgi:hypothetical protein